MTTPTLRIAHLYADEMNIYGDRGNILTLTKRAEWRGITVEIRAVGRGPGADLSDANLIFWGGGQDRDQELVFKDAAAHKVTAIRRAIERGAGNNGEDQTEGVADGNVFGTYLHGSLLPKNPHFADLLIERALGPPAIGRLVPLADTEEMQAHQSVSDRVLGRPASTRS